MEDCTCPGGRLHIVAKPPSYTPITILEMANILAEAGLPGGVYNVVTGPGGIVGQALVDHPDVDMISLTGDTLTGQEIMAAPPPIRNA